MSDTAHVTMIPFCDLCRILTGERTPAAYDVRTRSGQWANVCPAHFLTDAMSANLGTGYGQRLVLVTRTA